MAAGPYLVPIDDLEPREERVVEPLAPEGVKMRAWKSTRL